MLLSSNIFPIVLIYIFLHTLYDNAFTKFSPLRHSFLADGIGRYNGVPIQCAVLLERRGTPNIWPVARYAELNSRAVPIVERVLVAVLQLTAAVYTANAERMREMLVIEVDTLLSWTNGIGIEEETEEINVKDLPEELLFDIPKASIVYARKSGPDDDEMGNRNHAFQDYDNDESTYVNGKACRFSKRH